VAVGLGGGFINLIDVLDGGKTFFQLMVVLLSVAVLVLVVRAHRALGGPS
jgi:hypothetical protein